MLCPVHAMHGVAYAVVFVSGSAAKEVKFWEWGHRRAAAWSGSPADCRQYTHPGDD